VTTEFLSEGSLPFEEELVECGILLFEELSITLNCILPKVPMDPEDVLDSKGAVKYRFVLISK
jgi:hypothetical protein